MGLKKQLAEWLKKRVYVEPNNGEILVSSTNLRLDQNDMIRQMIRQEIFRSQVNEGAESFEDADDFELDEGEQWVSDYEEGFDPPSVTTPVSTESATTPPPAPVQTPQPPAGDDQA